MSLVQRSRLKKCQVLGSNHKIKYLFQRSRLKYREVALQGSTYFREVGLSSEK